MASQAKRRKTGEDYKERLKLKELIEEPRYVSPLPEDKVTEKIQTSSEKGETKMMSLKDIEDQLKASEIGQRLKKGGSVPVPMVDYIKEKYRILSVETTARLDRDLISMYQDLISKGFTEDELKLAINGKKLAPKKEETSRFQE